MHIDIILNTYHYYRYYYCKTNHGNLVLSIAFVKNNQSSPQCFAPALFLHHKSEHLVCNRQNLIICWHLYYVHLLNTARHIILTYYIFTRRPYHNIIDLDHDHDNSATRQYISKCHKTSLGIFYFLLCILYSNDTLFALSHRRQRLNHSSIKKSPSNTDIWFCFLFGLCVFFFWEDYYYCFYRKQFNCTSTSATGLQVVAIKYIHLFRYLLYYYVYELGLQARYVCIRTKDSTQLFVKSYYIMQSTLLINLYYYYY